MTPRRGFILAVSIREMRCLPLRITSDRSTVARKRGHNETKGMRESTTPGNGYRWPGGFIAGEQVTAHGTPWHGKTGTVVTEWKSHWYRRPGLVAVFLPDFPNTGFWWFAPHNLKRNV